MPANSIQSVQRTSLVKKAKELSKYIRSERSDYNYLKSLFRQLRKELEIEVPRSSKKLPYVPTEDEIKNYYEEVWNTKRFQDMLIIKVLIYTGVRVNELINIKLIDINLLNCQIRITHGK